MTDLCRLHYIACGNPSRPAVLFLHGFLGSGWDWSEITSGLSREFYCVAPDLPGHRGTAKSASPKAYSMEGAAAALLELLDQLSAARCALVGYSMGGRLALHLADAHPRRWTRLVLESASPGIDNPSERRERQALDSKLADKLEGGDFETFLRDWYEQPLFESLQRDEANFQRILERRRNNDPVELAKAMRGMSAGAQPSLWNKIAKLDMPILILAGEHDAKYREIGGETARRCAAARFALVADAGHNAHAENPKEYTRALKEFLTQPSR